jgi:hypothetical protein
MMNSTTNGLDGVITAANALLLDEEDQRYTEYIHRYHRLLSIQDTGADRIACFIQWNSAIFKLI